jgi:hypothetical protein
MPPKSPAGKKAKEFVAIYSGVATAYPEVGAAAARCIALGAQIESLYGAILTTMLGANASPAAAMYRSLESINAKSAVVHAAAQAVLTPEEMDLLSAVTAICNRALKHRHRLAHWVWGKSAAYARAVVLIDPKHLLEYETGIGRFMYPNEGRGLLESFDTKTCLIYDLEALNEAAAELVAAENYLAQVRFSIVPNIRKLAPKHGLGLPQLAAQPAIAAELQALEKRRQKNPAKPVRQRGRGRAAT